MHRNTLVVNKIFHRKEVHITNVPHFLSHFPNVYMIGPFLYYICISIASIYILVIAVFLAAYHQLKYTSIHSPLPNPNLNPNVCYGQIYYTHSTICGYLFTNYMRSACRLSLPMELFARIPQYFPTGANFIFFFHRPTV